MRAIKYNQKKIQKLYITKAILAMVCLFGFILLLITAGGSDLNILNLKQIFVRGVTAISMMGFAAAGIRVCNQESEKAQQRIEKYNQQRANIIYLNQKTAKKTQAV